MIQAGRWIAFITFVLVFSLPSRNALAQNNSNFSISSKELLGKIRSNRESLKIFACEIASTSSYHFENLKGKAPWQEKVITKARFDGLRSESIIDRFQLNGSTLKPILKQHAFWDGTRQSMYTEKTDPDNVKTGNMRNIATLMFTDIPEVEHNYAVNPDGGAGLDGLLMGDEKYFDEILGTASDLSIASQHEIVGNVACIVLSGSTESGKYTVWLDPEKSYCLRQAKVERGPENLAWGIKLKMYHGSRRSKMETKITNVIIERTGDLFYAAGGTLEERIIFEGGAIYIANHRISRSKNFYPNFEHLRAFCLSDVINGTRVFGDKIVVPSEWKDGKVIPLDNLPIDSSNGGVTKVKAKGRLTQLDLPGHPLDLKFTAIDGRKVDMGTLKGKVVLVDFWATWCGPCVDEVPNLEKVYNTYHEKGFEIIGISLDEDQQALKNFIEKNEVKWPQYFDGKGWKNGISSRFGINSIPTMWLIGKDGIVVTMEGRENLEAQVKKLIDDGKLN